MMRCFQRALRRALLPLKMTEGFNPRPRMSFPMPLSVGAVGWDEIMEFRLDRWVPPTKVHERLEAALPDGISVRSVETVQPGRHQAVDWVEYRLALPADVIDRVADAADELTRAERYPVVRDTQGRRKTIDLRPYVLSVGLDGTELVTRLRVTARGTARPAEVLDALGIGDVAARGAVLRRTRVALG